MVDIDQGFGADRKDRTNRPGFVHAVFWFQDRILLNLATVLMALGIGVMFFEAASRTLAAQSHWWAEELVRFLVIWSVLMSVGIASYNGHFIRMDLFVNALPRRGVLASAGISSIVGIVFSSFLMWAGYLHVSHLYRIGMMTESNLDLPIWTVRLVLPLAGFLYFVYFVTCLLETLRGRDPFAVGKAH